MKIICVQENLKNSIAHLERIASKNQNTPILHNILFKTGEGEVILFTTDLEIGLHIQVPCKVEKKGEAVIPLKSIAYFIYNLPNIKITIEEKGKNISIEADDIKTIIPTANKSEFPLIPKIKKEQQIKIAAPTLKSTLTQVLNAAAVSYSIPEISGIFFQFQNEVLKVVSTDSFRLSEKIVYQKGNYEITKPTSFILPQKTAQELIRIIDQESPIIIFIEQNQISFELENKYLTSRLISGTYPNYEQIIPKDTHTKFFIHKTEFSSKVKLASIFSSKLNNIHFIAHAKKNIVEIKSADEVKGEFNSTLQVSVSGKDAEAVFNYKYILEGIANIFEEEILFELNGSSAPAILSGKNNGYRYVVMPIKI